MLVPVCTTLEPAFTIPRIGQFLSPDADTIIASGGNQNLTYARNNPNRWVDPDGRQDMGRSGGYSMTFRMSINVGGGMSGGFGGFSGPGPSFLSSPNISFNFGPPGVHGGNFSFGGPSLQAFSGSNGTPALTTSGPGTLNFGNSGPMLSHGFQGGPPVTGGGIGNNLGTSAVSVQPGSSPSPNDSKFERQWEIGQAIMDELGGGGEPQSVTPIGDAIDLLMLLHSSDPVTSPAFNPNDWGW